MNTEDFEKYQYGVLSAIGDGVDYYQVVSWCRANIPQDRWQLIGYNDFVIGFGHEEDYMMCLLVWG